MCVFLFFFFHESSLVKSVFIKLRPRAEERAGSNVSVVSKP